MNFVLKNLLSLLSIDYFFIIIIIVSFFENATVAYSLESLCVCVRVYFCTVTLKEMNLGT